MQARFGERTAQTYLRNKERRCFPTLLCGRRNDAALWGPHSVHQLEYKLLAVPFLRLGAFTMTKGGFDGNQQECENLGRDGESQGQDQRAAVPAERAGAEAPGGRE